MSTTNTTKPAEPATVASSVPAWMKLYNEDGTWNMAGLFFWLVMLVVLVMVLQAFGWVDLAIMKQLNYKGKGDEFYSEV
mgnify:CR=1 FL=1